MTSDDDIYGLNNGESTKYNPDKFIPIPPFQVRSVVDTIASSHRDAEPILVKVMKYIKKFDELYTEDVGYFYQENQTCKAIFFWL